MDDWVVRGGIADWENLRDAYIIDRRVAPPVFGFSVQYAPNMTWEDLVKAGQIPNGKVCYADRSMLETAMAQLGYTLLLVAAPGRGYHHELSLALAKDGQMLTSLPDDAAQALSDIFRQHQVANPFHKKKAP